MGKRAEVHRAICLISEFREDPNRGGSTKDRVCLREYLPNSNQSSDLPPAPRRPPNNAIPATNETQATPAEALHTANT